MEILSHSPKDTYQLAQRVAAASKGGDVIALFGDLGSGKTTFVKGFVSFFTSDYEAQSPTFVFIRTYPLRKENLSAINHIDLYRTTIEEEVYDLGLFDLFEDTKTITLIEWPDIIKGNLPKNIKKFEFSYISESVRKIKYV